jgi:L-histidine Nalpha-methyltransferase
VALDVEFLAGETIWTESSHKYSTEEIVRMSGDTGFRCQAQWVDEEWSFAESLLTAE